MNKNRIERPTRWGELAPHSKAVGLIVEVNAAVALGSNAFLPGETPTGQPEGESAEAIVMCSKPGDERRPLKHETGSLDAMKGQTKQERPTEWRTP